MSGLMDLATQMVMWLFKWSHYLFFGGAESHSIIAKARHSGYFYIIRT